MRFVETVGKATEFAVDSPFLPVTQAFECDLVENDRRALEVTGNRIKVMVPAFGFATVRIFRGEQPAIPSNVIARAISDGQVNLAWQTVPAAHSYFVYRSDDPDAPATAYTLVGRTAKPALEDSGLKVGTEYTYRVAAVSRSNEQSDPSKPVVVSTSTKNTTPPPPIEELGVVRRAADRLMVFWRKLDHPDVARYFLYRSDEPGIDMRTAKPIATLKPSGDFLELYMDSALQPGKTYYYKVAAEDWGANRQTRSPETHATTPAQ
jgi:fibronectin type 3 domain-containing protein